MIYGRPELNKEMGKIRFLEFYYTEQEMVDFCKKNGLDVIGDRNDLKIRIAAFLNGGKTEEQKFVLKDDSTSGVITHGSLLGEGFEYSDRQELFFTEAIGPEYTAYEDFVIWLQKNPGKTYGEAAEFWYLMHDSQ